MAQYSISEAARQTSLSCHTLRYYESAGLLPGVSKDVSGRRIYTDFDLKTLKFIKVLRETGMSIKQIAEYGELYLKGKKTVRQRKDLLESHRQKILSRIKEHREYLKIIEEKIAVTSGK
jgi:DNA-binding transcriptional MerR regulator